MTVIEYGEENTDVIILLHGGGLSWWNYKEEAELLQERFHIVIPVLDGHADSDKDFISIENNATEIISYIDENFGGSVLLIGGLSLGGQILVDILSQREDICKYAIIESALVIPMKFTYSLIKPTFNMSFGLVKNKWFSRLQFWSLKIKNELYDLYYKDTCKISKENMISFLKANSSYSIKSELSKNKAKVAIFVGEKEQQKMKKSAEIINKMIKQSTLTILKDSYHGEFSINNAKNYVDSIYSLIG